jgi:hypothetical protein
MKTETEAVADAFKTVSAMLVIAVVGSLIATMLPSFDLNMACKLTFSFRIIF